MGKTTPGNKKQQVGRLFCPIHLNVRRDRIREGDVIRISFNGIKIIKGRDTEYVSWVEILK